MVLAADTWHRGQVLQGTNMLADFVLGLDLLYDEGENYLKLRDTPTLLQSPHSIAIWVRSEESAR